MPLARFAKLEPAKRDRLLEVAAAEFARCGYADASLNDILAASGLGKSSYYYYFADKHDLFATVIDGVYRALEDAVSPANLDVETADEFWAAIERQYLDWLKAVMQMPHAAGVLRAVQVFRTAGTTGPAIASRMSALLRASIVQGRARGFVRKDLEVEVLVAIVEGADAALDAALYSQDAQPSPARLRAHVRLALDTARRLLGPSTR
jgi:AcrR family transcriptional regulator